MSALSQLWNAIRVRPLDAATVFGLVFLLFAFSGLAFDYGMTWDEVHQDFRGAAELSRLRGTGEGQTSFLYGGGFDILCAWFQEKLHPLPNHVTRHLLNSVFGWLGVLFSVLLARRLFGPWAGLLTLVLLPLSPRFFAHAMNNSKDVPFATAHVAGLYALSFLSPRWPHIDYKTGLGMALAIGVAVGIRVPGLVLLGYLFVFVVIATLFSGGAPRAIGRRGGWLWGAMGAVTLAVLALAWPSLVLDPWGGLSRAIDFVGGEKFNHVLFRGKFYLQGKLPPWYALEIYGITAPVPVLLLFLTSFPLLLNRRTDWRVLGVYVSVLFPLLATVLFSGILYNGVRHVLFTYPPIVILASGAAVAWMARLQDRRWRMVSLFAFLLLLIPPARFQVRNHPHQVVFYNWLVGGVPGAAGRYELDYWASCYKQSFDRLEARAAAGARGEKKGRVGALRPGHIVKRYARYSSHLSFTHHLREAQFYISTVGRYDAGLQKKIAESDEILDLIQVDGIPICYTLDLRQKGRDLDLPVTRIAKLEFRREALTFRRKQ